MNFYERHIGDYLKDTAHLSLLEHGVYTRLLDIYYTRESGIPQADAPRLVGARSREDRAALSAVLAEFFELVDGSYVQRRAEREIERLRDKRRKASASASARWSQSERNANASEAHMRTDSGRTADAMRTHSEGNARAPVPSPQSPVPSPQSPNPTHPSDAPATGAAKSPRPSRKAPPDFTLTVERLLWAKANTPAVNAQAETAKFLDHTFRNALTDWDGAWRNWMRRAAETTTKRVNGNHAPQSTAERDAEARRLLGFDQPAGETHA